MYQKFFKNYLKFNLFQIPYKSAQYYTKVGQKNNRFKFLKEKSINLTNK